MSMKELKDLGFRVGGKGRWEEDCFSTSKKGFHLEMCCNFAKQKYAPTLNNTIQPTTTTILIAIQLLLV
jgi:hypothetical protein